MSTVERPPDNKWLLNGFSVSFTCPPSSPSLPQNFSKWLLCSFHLALLVDAMCPITFHPKVKAFSKMSQNGFWISFTCPNTLVRRMKSFPKTFHKFLLRNRQIFFKKMKLPLIIIIIFVIHISVSMLWKYKIHLSLIVFARGGLRSAGRQAPAARGVWAWLVCSREAAAWQGWQNGATCAWGAPSASTCGRSRSEWWVTCQSTCRRGTRTWTTFWVCGLGAARRCFRFRIECSVCK